MFKNLLNKKMIGLVLQQKSLRLSLLLSGVLFIILIALIITNFTFSKRVTNNENQILDIKTQLEELDKIASEDEITIDPRVEGRIFAPYDEIVPYVSLLESLFGIIDEESTITIKDKENQIYINRYADYEIRLSPKNRMPLLIKALEELHKSKYISKVTNFSISYSPNKEESGNEVRDVMLTIRLYFE